MLSHKFTIGLIFASLFACASVLAAESKSNIKKCKDEDGKWHYGDTAADECAKSKITVITNKGTTKKVIAAPPTEQELKDREAQREQLEAEKIKAVEQKRKDEILLSTYGVESDITYIRDRKIAQIESQIKASQETLKSLRGALTRMEAQAKDDSKDTDSAKNIDATRNQIKRHEGVITQKREEQEALRKQYAEELERYRELKKKALVAPASSAKK